MAVSGLSLGLAWQKSVVGLILLAKHFSVDFADISH